MNYLKKTTYYLILLSVTFIFQNCMEENLNMESEQIILTNTSKNIDSFINEGNISNENSNSSMRNVVPEYPLDEQIPYKYFLITYNTPFSSFSILNYLHLNGCNSVVQNSTSNPNVFLIRIYCLEDETLVYNTLSLYPNLVEEIIEPTVIRITYKSNISIIRKYEIRNDFINDIYNLNTFLTNSLPLFTDSEFWVFSTCCQAASICPTIEVNYDYEVVNDESVQ